jgi:hypothetical protein
LLYSSGKILQIGGSGHPITANPNNYLGQGMALKKVLVSIQHMRLQYFLGLTGTLRTNVLLGLCRRIGLCTSHQIIAVETV